MRFAVKFAIYNTPRDSSSAISPLLRRSAPRCRTCRPAPLRSSELHRPTPKKPKLTKHTYDSISGRHCLRHPALLPARKRAGKTEFIRGSQSGTAPRLHLLPPFLRPQAAGQVYREGAASPEAYPHQRSGHTRRVNDAPPRGPRLFGVLLTAQHDDPQKQDRDSRANHPN